MRAPLDCYYYYHYCYIVWHKQKVNHMRERALHTNATNVVTAARTLFIRAQNTIITAKKPKEKYVSTITFFLSPFANDYAAVVASAAAIAAVILLCVAALPRVHDNDKFLF